MQRLGLGIVSVPPVREIEIRVFSIFRRPDEALPGPRSFVSVGIHDGQQIPGGATAKLAAPNELVHQPKDHDRANPLAGVEPSLQPDFGSPIVRVRW